MQGNSFYLQWPAQLQNKLSGNNNAALCFSFNFSSSQKQFSWPQKFYHPPTTGIILLNLSNYFVSQHLRSLTLSGSQMQNLKLNISQMLLYVFICSLMLTCQEIQVIEIGKEKKPHNMPFFNYGGFKTMTFRSTLKYHLVLLEGPNS